MTAALRVLPASGGHHDRRATLDHALLRFADLRLRRAEPSVVVPCREASGGEPQTRGMDGADQLPIEAAGQARVFVTPIC